MKLSNRYHVTECVIPDALKFNAGEIDNTIIKSPQLSLTMLIY